MDALKDLRVLAIREALGEFVGSDVLIETGLRALLDGVESPSLPLLASLSRREEGDAHDLFHAVAVELDLAPTAAIDTQSARWQLVRWQCEAIADGSAEPEAAGHLIWFQGWNELGYPDSLRPIVGWVSEWEDWTPSWGMERDHYRRLIVEEAKGLLDGPWPPE
ncbi:hypothetical protein [Arthrobacter sp. B2a2-09]|uniref:hypothetical protein n=1 Tax=Arthrobacter sp. B2a2-09 TaxID=2952822 RepID=UPI0022CD9ADB|nr:hypothetical protein [Arthrobacter sp. B2a2-09]MCZ9882965.1 hypothetical protein [Arthrobacter sp. B2a2-09]